MDWVGFTLLEPEFQKATIDKQEQCFPLIQYLDLRRPYDLGQAHESPTVDFFFNLFIGNFFLTSLLEYNCFTMVC